VQLGTAQSSGVLELHVEAAGLAEALDRGRYQHEDLGVANARAQLLHRALRDRLCAVLCAWTLVPGLQQQVAEAGVLSLSGKTEACDREHLRHVRLLLILEEIP